MIKYCPKCKKQKNISEFNKDNKTKDKLYYCCRICSNKNRTKNRNENKERERKYNKKYFKSKQGKLAVKKYKRSEKGIIANQKCCRKRRANKNNIIELFTNKEWINMKNKTNGICPNCNIKVGINNLQLDHIYPISKANKGRIYTIEDIQPLCKSCNSSKRNKI